MECKWDYKSKLKPGDICELIDTLWNVNEEIGGLRKG